MVEVVRVLRLGPEKINTFCRVRMKNSKSPEVLESLEVVRKVEVLHRDAWEYYCFLDENTPEILAQFMLPSISILRPFRLTSHTLELGLLGSEEDVARVFDLLEAVGVEYELVSTETFALHGHGLGTSAPLTPRQSEVLSVAYHLGYYDIPRGVDSGKLAGILKIKRSTLLEHLRKVERALVADYCERETLE
ncbi:MAG: helix-turn-helix domain-containing protein [Promethearchaeota archaeon]